MVNVEDVEDGINPGVGDQLHNVNPTDVNNDEGHQPEELQLTARVEVEQDQHLNGG